MAVIRINKTADYTVMSNSHFREREMTLKAKGLLSLMLSLPDSWDYSIAGLVTLSKDGKDSVMAALAELEEFGYLKRTRTFDEKGRFSGWDYDIFEIPQTEKPYAENPNTDKPNTEIPQQSNTNLLNKKELKNKEKKDIYSPKITEILSYMNDKLQTKYKENTKTTRGHIKARLDDGFTVDDFKTVIDKKTEAWRGTEMAKYLRPETLFGTKFESYLNEQVVKTNKKAKIEEPTDWDDLV